MVVVKKGLGGGRKVKDTKWTKEEIHHQTWMSETANRERATKLYIIYTRH